MTHLMWRKLCCFYEYNCCNLCLSAVYFAEFPLSLVLSLDRPLTKKFLKVQDEGWGGILFFDFSLRVVDFKCSSVEYPKKIRVD